MVTVKIFANITMGPVKVMVIPRGWGKLVVVSGDTAVHVMLMLFKIFR